MTKLTLITAVWSKGVLAFRYNPWLQRYELLDLYFWRLDIFGNLIFFFDYGNRDSVYGWEIDHIIPGGPTELWNLQPLQWYANVKKSDYFLTPILRALFS